MGRPWASPDSTSHGRLLPPGILPLPSSRRTAPDEDDDDDDDDEEEDDDDEEEDEDDDEDGGPSSVPGEPELSRAERRELKKKQGEQPATIAEEDGEDELIANPNRLTKKLNISDLAAPRELTRRERCVPSQVNSLNK